ncbi:hypothetical protein J421_2538 [Gemmatirosa kalamazoonensis]|uniref:Uncharacterized protein n=1 Tax=Gemmatirosa kalamazoonensis TaxID=861299 RepID=W0RIB3_9BACT|nr:hypothetical protein [Gemmatirosa kalamazoonensis]AHG90075.1 hypothetical protein J421_2538 [Gemmatirosa kalamazoonensis]
MRRATMWAVAAAAVLGTERVGAQDAADDAGRLFPLLDIGVARAFGATLADRSVTGTSGGQAYHESMRLRLDGQWGIIAEGRVPLGRAKVWGIEAYGARFRGRGRLDAARQVASPVTTAVLDTLNAPLRGVTSWRGTLGVVRAVPLPARLTGALLVGGTYGTVRSGGQACQSVVVAPALVFPPPGQPCAPALDLTTPGATLGADVFTPEWRGLRLRAALKGDVLRVDEAEVRRSMHWGAFAASPLGEGAARWHVLPSFTVGVEFRIPL